jgi:porin-like protein
MKKTTLATLVGAAAFAAAGAANATIVVGGENGYEFSVDGNINQFYTYADADTASGDVKNSGVENGLLPTFFGFNVKAPEINGLTVAARVSISPSTNGGSYTANNFGQGNAMEQREAFATVDGGFGQIMLGKGLGLYAANNILLDQTLYGVGATGGDSGITTLGRIGYGYDYANWRSQIRWTSVDMAGFKVALAVMDADKVGAFTNTDGDFATAASGEQDPRYEASLSYGTAFDGGSLKLWLDGMSQEVEATTDAGAGTSIKSSAYTLGGQVMLGGFEFVAAYYDNKGVGDLGGLVYSSATDVNGDERDGDGYYAQIGYNFAGSTWVKASYGESTLDRTSDEKSGAITNAYDIDTRSMTTVGIYHDVTANLKLVAEYSQMEDEFHSATDDTDTDVFSVGGFISW